MQVGTRLLALVLCLPDVMLVASRKKTKQKTIELLNFDWDLLIKLLAAIATLIGLALQFRKFNPRKRLLLKTDLEILKEINEEDQNHATVKEYIDNHVKSIYVESDRLKVYDTFGLIYGVIFILGFSYWSVSLYNTNNGFTFWMIFTGFAVFIWNILSTN